MTAFYCRAENRAVLRVAGPDARAFLQGIVSNDVDKATEQRAIWAAFLTPQGKYLHDFFIVAQDSDLLLDCEAARRDDLATRLSRYRLRSKVTIAPEDGLAVGIAWGDGATAALDLPNEAGAAAELGAGPAAGAEGGIAFVDPRHAEGGVRLLLPADRLEAWARERELDAAPFADWDAHRLALGLPDGSRDLEVDKTVLLEAGFHELSGVDWGKGCYMGQELTARTYYRGLLKRRLFPVEIAGTADPGTQVLQDGKEVGELRSVADGRAIALLRLEALETDTPLTAGDATVTPQLPDWMVLKPVARN